MILHNFKLNALHTKLSYGDFSYDIFDCPALWADQKQLEHIQRRINTIAYESCGKYPQKGLYVDTSLMKDKLITICSYRSKDCAFGAMARIGAYEGRNILHTGPGYSSLTNKGMLLKAFVLGILFYLIKNRLQSFYFTTVTHVPKVFGIIVDRGKPFVYPNASNNALPKREHIEVRDLLLNSYIKEIEPEYQHQKKNGFILKGFRLQKDGSIVPYPHTARTVPKHKKQIYNDRCLSLIDYDNGDAMIIVMKFDLPLVLKQLKHLAP